MENYPEITLREKIDNAEERFLKSIMKIENKPEKDLLVDVLDVVGMSQLLEKFRSEEIDFEALQLSTALEPWKVLNIPFGFAKKIKYEADKRSKLS